MFTSDVICEAYPTEGRYGEPAMTALANAAKIARALNDGALRTNDALCAHAFRDSTTDKCSHCEVQLFWHAAEEVWRPHPVNGPDTCCWDRIVDPGTPGDPADPAMPYVCTMPKGHVGDVHEHREDFGVLARWITRDEDRRFVLDPFDTRPDYPSIGQKVRCISLGYTGCGVVIDIQKRIKIRYDETGGEGWSDADRYAPFGQDFDSANAAQPPTKAR